MVSRLLLLLLLLLLLFFVFFVFFFKERCCRRPTTESNILIQIRPDVFFGPDLGPNCFAKVKVATRTLISVFEQRVTLLHVTPDVWLMQNSLVMVWITIYEVLWLNSRTTSRFTKMPADYNNLSVYIYPFTAMYHDCTNYYQSRLKHSRG